MRRRHTSWLGVALPALACLTCGVGVHASTIVDPSLAFRTLSTEHFLIHFHQGEDGLAHRLAAIAEDVWSKAGQAVGVRAPRRTHVILADQSEMANGWATPLPYDTIFITAAAPSGSEFIGRTDDWLRLVFTHEFTHIVHLDRSAGWSRVFRGIFGRTPIAFPNLWLPTWVIEGLAEWEESALTGEGRLHAGDFRAIEREAGRSQRVEPLDRVNGGLTDWPMGLAPYAFGLGFHEYLAGRFGEQTFAALAARTAKSLPFLGTRAFEHVYGESLHDLWKDYSAVLVSRAGTPATRTSPAATPAPLRLTQHGHIVLGPRFAPAACRGCPDEIVYSVRNPDDLPSLRAIGLDGASSRRLATRYLGSTAAVTGRTIVFDQQEVRRNVAIYSDLYALDRVTGNVRALTRDRRLQDPDVSPDGRFIVCVREDRGRRDLVLMPLTAGQVGEVTTLASEPEAQFNAPRWSPDGRSIAVARHRLGAQSEIVLFDMATRAIRVLASDPASRMVTPTWRPDGAAVIAAADYDGDTFNLYEFSTTEGGTTAKQLTTTSGGALWPDVSPDGRTIVFAGYAADGFDVFTLPYPDTPPSLVKVKAVALVPDSVPPPLNTAAGRPASRYSPRSTLAPTSWAPIVESADGLRAGFSTGGVDVLGRHAYVASATWLVSPPESVVTPDLAVPDWGAGYAYSRWRPTFFVSAASNTLFSAGPPNAGGRPTAATVREREVEGGILLPVHHVRVSHRGVVSLARTSETHVFSEEAPSRNRTASRVGFETTTAHTFGYSISRERGIVAGATAEFVSRAPGSSAGTTTATADARAYLPGLADHHVVALRVSGGRASGAPGLGRTFLLGGAAANLNVLDFGRQAFSLMRGFPADSFAGTRVALLNADYRFPVARPQRGIGAWPILFHTVHAAVFGDVGETWIDRFRTRDLKTSVGGEISVDLVAGYSFPFTAAAGIGWGHNATDATSGASFYVRIGKAF